MPLGMLGKYERLDVLGHGASGIVYLAKDTLLGRTVALKEVAASDANERERVLSEARVLDRLRHPSIVQIYGVDEIDGKVVIAMEYVRGRSLLDVLRRTPQLSIPDAVNIAAQICDGLAFAHAQRTVHRDVKPANVLVADDGTVKLVDFGLAEVLGTHSLAGGAGTYAYMAPEDFGGAGGGRASDIWAAGVVLWEMLAGRRPFRVGNPKDPFAWKTAIDSGPAPLILSVRPDVPAELDAVLSRALSRDPAARDDAGAMAEALKELAPPAPQVWGEGTSRSIGLPQGGEELSAVLPQGGEDMSVLPRSGTRPSAKVTSLLPAVEALRTGAKLGGPGGPVLPDDPPTVAQTSASLSLPGFADAADIDAFLAQAPDHWEQAKQNLTDGTLSAWLLSIGEGPLAEVAAALSAETERDADDRLRDFLYRAGLDNDGEAHRAHAEGVRLVRAGRPIDAVPLLERAVRLHPAPAVYHRALAAALLDDTIRGAQQFAVEQKQKLADARETGVNPGSSPITLSTNAVDFGALRVGQTRAARIVLRNPHRGVVQGRVASAPGWVRVEPAAFATRHRQPLVLTAHADGVWPARGVKLTEAIACEGVLVIETDGGAREEVSLSAAVLPARRGLSQIALWYLPLLVTCLLLSLAGLSAPHRAGHIVRHLWEPGLLAGGLLSASLFALACAADTVLPLRLLPLALLALLGGGFFGSVGNVDMTHALKAALVQTSVPVLVMLVLQTLALALDPRGWGRWQLWRWIAGATGLLASYVLWHSG